MGSKADRFEDLIKNMSFSGKGGKQPIIAKVAPQCQSMRPAA